MFSIFNLLFMKNLLLFTSFFLITYISSAQNKNIRQIARLDPALDSIIEKNAKIDVIGDGFLWSEGPVWVKNGGYLLFSDVPANTVYKWKEGEKITEFLNPSGYTGILPYSYEPGSNGLIINNVGQLIPNYALEN